MIGFGTHTLSDSWLCMVLTQSPPLSSAYLSPSRFFSYHHLCSISPLPLPSSLHSPFIPVAVSRITSSFCPVSMNLGLNQYLLACLLWYVLETVRAKWSCAGGIAQLLRPKGDGGYFSLWESPLYGRLISILGNAFHHPFNPHCGAFIA